MVPYQVRKMPGLSLNPFLTMSNPKISIQRKRTLKQQFFKKPQHIEAITEHWKNKATHG
jgi:hypothetical protein